MAIRYLIYAFAATVITLAGMSCSTESSEIVEEILQENIDSQPYLYQSQSDFKSKNLGVLKIRPVHRDGPNVLPFYSYSDLKVTVWIPEESPQPLPVVIYSHHGEARIVSDDTEKEWANALTKAGYAVIAMHHMIRSTEDIIINICGELGVSSEDCKVSTYKKYYESTDRAKDAVAVIDSLENIGDYFGVSFDQSKIAVMGFAEGTNATHYLAGGEKNALFDISENPEYFNIIESRPKAFLALSPEPGTHMGWTSQSLSNINQPFLSITGLADDASSQRADFYNQLNGKDQYRLFINSQSSYQGVYNLDTFGDEADILAQQDFHNWINTAGIAFFDAYLEENTEALAWLKSDFLSRIIHETLSENQDIHTWSKR